MAFFVSADDLSQLVIVVPSIVKSPRVDFPVAAWVASMGLIPVPIQLLNPSRPDLHPVEVSALVDTGTLLGALSQD